MNEHTLAVAVCSNVVANVGLWARRENIVTMSFNIGNIVSKLS